jgi:hypothetical protein
LSYTSGSIVGTLKPAGLEKSKGLIIAVASLDPTPTGFRRRIVSPMSRRSAFGADSRRFRVDLA